MNDPFECLAIARRSFTKEKLEELRNYGRRSPNSVLQRISALDDESITNLLNDQRKNPLDVYAFCSLSESMDDILMWSHYASSHEGFVLGFEFKNFNDHSLQKVNYVESLEDSDFDLIGFAKFMEGDNTFLNHIFKDYSVKSKVWSNEKEWRIWLREPSYYHYEPNELKEIYFGINCSVETKSIVSQLNPNKDEEFLYMQMEFENNPVRLKF